MVPREQPSSSFRWRVVSGSDRNLEPGFDPGVNIPKAGLQNGRGWQQGGRAYLV
ncbi:Hypothetical predicted protein [Podarcis lilfordi]|uniref:Uncharacterized protein n=1 Tax=Podarcis lilfordi TaxID=74358 RepID=A0AA35P4F3_9SAUR|nr:Hypothetical predicted protein [Podarcis lilfordi]